MHARIKMRTFTTADAAGRALARDVAHAVASNPTLVLGLPTGRTPVPFYRRLVALYRAGGLDFSRITTFNLDEFIGVAPDNPCSYRAVMERTLFAQVNLDRHRIHMLNGVAADADAECERFERDIRRAGGIDLLVLGLGTNGHIGFNEPAAALSARTHHVRLTLPTRRANRALFGGDLRQVPRAGLTMGMATILQARRLVLLATGGSKVTAVRRLTCGPITPMVPASFLQLHASAEVWVDEAAAPAGLRGVRRSWRQPVRR